jgi:hypothetical protein
MSPTVEIAAARNERSDSFVGAGPVGSGGDWLGGARGGVVVTLGAAADGVVVVGATGGGAGDGATVVGGAIVEVAVVTGGSLDVDDGEVVVGGGGARLVVVVGVPQSGSLSGPRTLPLRPGARSNPGADRRPGADTRPGGQCPSGEELAIAGSSAESHPAPASTTIAPAAPSPIHLAAERIATDPPTSRLPHRGHTVQPRRRQPIGRPRAAFASKRHRRQSENHALSPVSNIAGDKVVSAERDESSMRAAVRNVMNESDEHDGGHPMELKKILVGGAISAATLISLGGVSHAGEVTGNDTTTPVKAFRAASICSFSGLDAVDGSSIDPDDEDDAFWPGRTQSFGQIVRQFGGPATGGAGADCRPGGGE